MLVEERSPIFLFCLGVVFAKRLFLLSEEGFRVWGVEYRAERLEGFRVGFGGLGFS